MSERESEETKSPNKREGDYKFFEKVKGSERLKYAGALVVGLFGATTISLSGIPDEVKSFLIPVVGGMELNFICRTIGFPKERSLRASAYFLTGWNFSSHPGPEGILGLFLGAGIAGAINEWTHPTYFEDKAVKKA